MLVQECEQVNVLIDMIKSLLEDLLKGCSGELGFTDAMEKLQVVLMTGKVPFIWQKSCFQREIEPHVTPAINYNKDKYKAQKK